MKNLFFVFISVFYFITFTFSKVEFIERSTKDYRSEVNLNKTIFIEMKFGNYNNDKIKHVIPKNAEVLYVDVVYTDFPKGRYYTELNQNRAKKAKELFPELKNKDITWNLVKQTACKNKKEAEALFHGVVIVFREKPTPESMKVEISSIESFLKGGSSKSSVFAANKRSESVEEMPYSTVIKSTSSPIIFSYYNGYNIPLLDSMFFKIFKRNNFDKAAIVGDVTGSMSPYTAQFLLWLKLNEGNKMIQSYTFFNDGDNTPDRMKTIGKTGGIYTSENTKYSEVEKTVFSTMIKGGGGDGPENNIEAIIKIQEMDPSVKEIILVADNYAPVKDITLLSSIKKPVRVIVCGSTGFINPYYIQIAFNTGGSLHTIEEDLLRLSELKKGETIEFGGFKYKVVPGGLELIRGSKKA